jgi:hypothetical protein
MSSSTASPSCSCCFHDCFEHELVADIDFNMGLVTVVHFIVMLRPECVEVFANLDLHILFRDLEHYIDFD